MRRAAVLAALAAAGCGGGSGEPSAADREAELKRWAQEADEICQRTRLDIAARGGPIDLIDLDRVAVRAAEDVRAAIADLRRLRPPPHARAKAAEVVEPLDVVEPLLDELTSATEARDIAALRTLAVRIEAAATDFADAARAAGLRECGDADVPTAVSDAIVAPVYAIEVAAFNTWLERATIKATRDRPQSEREAAAFYARVNRLWTRALDRWTKLDEPERADDAAWAYHDVISAAASYAGEIAAQIDGGRRITPAWARRVERRFDRLDARLTRAMRRLGREIGARPAPLPRQPPPDSEEIS